MDLENYNKVFKYIVDRIKNNDTSDVPLDIGIEYYTFTEYFFKYIGVSQYSNISDYGPQALDYIDKTFPYCFMKLDNKSVDDAIKLYVLSQGGSIEQTNEIIEALKNTPMKHIDRHQTIYNQDMYQEEGYTDINNVVGTSIPKYQLSNLYDVLTTINDKNINSYISYLIVNNVFNDEQHFKKVFRGMAITEDEIGNKYVNEGNHRIFTYQALLKIREYLNVDSASKNYTVNTIITKKAELNHNITR